MHDCLKFYINGNWVESAGSHTHEVINPATEEVAGRNTVEMGSFDRVTIESFGEDELTFIASHAADFSVNLDGIWKALVKARPGGRVKEDALIILFTAFSIVMQQCEISDEEQLKLSNFFAEKYRSPPPLHNISSGALQGEVRKFLESLGCLRRK